MAEISHGELSCMLGKHRKEAFEEGRIVEKYRIKSIINKLIRENELFQDGNYKKGRKDILEILLFEINKYVKFNVVNI